MKKQALIVVDMLADFVDPEGALYCGETSRAIVEPIQKLLSGMRESDAAIIFVKDSHAEDDLEFDLFPPHCVAGTPGAEIVPEMEVRDGEHVVEKRRYSAFFNTPLEQILRDEQVEEVHIVGVCTSICVMETTSDLRNRDYEVVVHRDAVADFDPQAHDFALSRMEKILGARIG